MIIDVITEGKFSIVLRSGLSLLVSLCPWAVTFVRASQEGLRGMKLHISHLTGQLGSGKMVFLKEDFIKENGELWAYDKMSTFPFPSLEAWGGFLQISPWEPSGIPGGKAHEIVGPS